MIKAKTKKLKSILKCRTETFTEVSHIATLSKIISFDLIY